MHVRARGVVLVTFAIVAATHQSAVSQVCSVSELQELMPKGISPADGFGKSVAISGDWAIAGARDSNIAASHAGAAFLFRRDDAGTPGVLGDDIWLEAGTLVAEDAVPNQNFGTAVAISEDWAAVAAETGADLGYAAGAVYLYRREDNATPTETADDWWEFHDRLTSFDGRSSDRFGETLSLTDDWLVAGTPNNRTISGTYLVGAAYVFRRRGGRPPGDAFDDRWTFDAKLTASDGRSFDEFGTSVSISYPWIVVGAPYDHARYQESGSAYVFRRNAHLMPGLDAAELGLDAVERWTQVTKLTDPDTAPRFWFGASVSIDGGTIVVGAPRSNVAEERGGSAYVFGLDRHGTPIEALNYPWRLTDTLLPPDANVWDRFGTTVAVDGDWIVVGVPFDDRGGDNSGSAYVFGRNDNRTPENPADDSWSVIDKLTASAGVVDGRLGQPLVIDGETIAAGSKGAVYLFPFHTEGPYCGDACCNAYENCMNCPEDCFGCGDRCCTGAENACSCPADCTRTICGDGCQSGNEDCLSCPADCPQLFSLDMPGLTGSYSSAWGPDTREQEFQFPVRFLSVDEAWLHVRGRNQARYCEPTYYRLHSILDRVSSRDYVSATSSTLPFEADVPVSPTPNVYDGNGVIGLYVSMDAYGCFDGGSIVTDATLWFSAVPSPPASQPQ